MVCHRVQVPVGAKVAGVTAAGRPTAVLPGEYLVHELPTRIRGAARLFRFVGADAAGRDVHVDIDTLRPFLHAAGAGARGRELQAAA